MKKCSVGWGGGGVLGVLPPKNVVFLSSLDLISCNFSTIFAHFQTKRDFYWGGGRAKPFSVGGGGTKPLSGGGGGNTGAGGALPPPVYMLKEALV